MNVLDLVINSDLEPVSTVRVIPCLATSDYNMLFYNIHIKTIDSIVKRFHRDHKNADFDSIRAGVVAIDWDAVLTGNTKSVGLHSTRK